MFTKILWLFLSTLLINLHTNHACQMEGVIWVIPQSTTILDVDRGVIFSRQTTNIIGINQIVYNEDTPLNSGPYLNMYLNNENQFIVETNDNYPNYEEYETSSIITFNIIFNCADTTTSTMAMSVNIRDTNNNAPIFLPSNTYEYTVITPLPPGYALTGCISDLLVRDIDLTTESIIFNIEDNPYFEIASEEWEIPKEFKGVIKSTNFIMSIPEPITLQITATDVDGTGDPPLTTTATVTIQASTEFQLPQEPIFSQTFYTAEYSRNHKITLDQTISLRQGFDDGVTFNLGTEYANNFNLISDGNEALLTVTNPLSEETFALNQIYLTVNAVRELTSGASATIIVRLPEDIPLEFQQPLYQGSIEDTTLNLQQLVLSQGVDASVVTVTVSEEYSSYFTPSIEGNIISLTMSPLTATIIDENNLISFHVTATNGRSTAITSITLEIIKDDNVTPVFERSLYIGNFDEISGLNLEPINLIQGYDQSVTYELDGLYENYFTLTESGSQVLLTVTTTLPPQALLEPTILLSVIANKPRSVQATATVSITMPTGSQPNVAFDKALYEGILQNNVVQHEIITISGFTGTQVDVLGEYGALFSASVSAGVVVVSVASDASLPDAVTFVPLELRAGTATTVLLLTVEHSEIELPPTVTFSSPSYAIRVEVTQTGVVGQVAALSDNGEALTYGLIVDNAHLQQRISVDRSTGQLMLSAPVDSAVYTFQATATTVVSQVTGAAQVELTVDAATTCGDEIVVPPLLVIDRDEEEPHLNLVVASEGCRYTLANRWPVEQNWLYVDETGLHARVIDREDPAIAFMALSQVQVELTLHCDSDTTRTKRSLDQRLDWLGPYDYGTNKWVLTDSIPYNSRRTLVNLIVNDINDNFPIFVGSDQQPIAVGYPITELEELILPRALAELKATDADVGENAALSYWSPSPLLSVSPGTGSVHVRAGAVLLDDALLTVSATDRNGNGLTGDLQIIVKLLDLNNIAVVTVQDKFLDDEEQVLADLSAAVGYEVRVLRSAIITEDAEYEQEEQTRNRLQKSSTSGTTMQIYVYGLIQREPVSVEQLTNDIINTDVIAIDIVRAVSLEDYLEDRDTPAAASNTGLLVATIVLSVLLFLIIVAIILWYFLVWRKKRNYDEFSDKTSLASGSGSVEAMAKPEYVARPRLDIGELKRSERRLQDMLDAPVNSVPSTSGRSPEVKIPIIDTSLPIVIQDKLKDAEESPDEDEFGEIKDKKRRRSIVTFNENVEKIIHVDDDSSDINQTDEIYKF